MNGSKGKRVRIVIADDNDELRELLKLALELDCRLGLAGEAADGPETLSVVQEERPDLLVLDIGMPSLDGLQVLERLRATQPGLKVVIYSGFAGENVRRAALAAGAADYLVKGIEPQALADRLVAVSR